MANLAPCTAQFLLAPSDHVAFEKETSPAGRRDFPGKGNDLEECYEENVSVHICRWGWVFFQISDFPHEMAFPSFILQLLRVAGV